MWTEADRDSCFRRVSGLVAHLPETESGRWQSHFKVSVRGKRFASVLVDHHGDGKLALTCKAEPGEQQALISADPTRYFVPAYDGAHGWVGVHLDPEHEPDWDQISALLVQGWREAAPVGLVRTLDANA